MKLVRKRKYTGKELMELAESNPKLVIKYKDADPRGKENFVKRVQHKGDNRFLVLYSDESGDLINGQWEYDYYNEKNNMVIDYYEEDLESKLEEKIKILIQSISSEEKTAETVVGYFYKGLAITGNKEKLIEAGFSDETIEEASRIIIENR